MKIFGKNRLWMMMCLVTLFGLGLMLLPAMASACIDGYTITNKAKCPPGPSNYHVPDFSRPIEWSEPLDTEVRSGIAGKAKSVYCKYCEGKFDNVEIFRLVIHSGWTSYLSDATCEDYGDVYRFCYGCGKYDFVGTDNPLGHSFTKMISTTATCTSAGRSVYQCSRPNCYETQERDEPALGHDWLLTGGNAATCTSDGTGIYQCQREGCDAEETRTVQGGHLFSDWGASTATCQSPGTESRTCERCGVTETRDVPACDHDFEVISDNRTCTDSGSVYMKCRWCLESSVLYDAPALGHIEDTWIPDYEHEPSCTSQGLEYTVCSRCDKRVYRTLPALGHILVTDPAVEPTYTNTGRTEGKHCSRCGESVVPQEIIPTTGSLVIHINPSPSGYGRVTVDPILVEAGDLVTVIAYPERAPGTSDLYDICSLSITGETGPLEFTQTDTDTWTFIMPAEDVTVSPVFKKTVMVCFWNDDRATLLRQDMYFEGDIASYPDPNPQKASTTRSTYTFIGWTPAFAPLTSGYTEYTAVYEETLNSYLVTTTGEHCTVSPNQETVTVDDTVTLTITPETADYQLNSLTVRKGEQDITVNKVDDTTWTFVMPDGDVTVNATCTNPNIFLINFFDWDGTLLQSENFMRGTVPSYSGSVPVKASEGQVRYIFSGWTPKISSVSEDTDYTAVYQELTVLSVGENNLNLTAGTEKECIFSPAVDSPYIITCSGLYASVRLYNGENQIAPTESMTPSPWCIADLETGKEYTVRIKALQGAGDATVTVRRLYLVGLDPEMEHGSFTLNTSAGGYPVDDGNVIGLQYAGGPVSLSSEPEEGYALAELSLLDAAGNPLLPGENGWIMPESDITVYAHFIKTYTLTFEGDEHARFTAIWLDGGGMPVWEDMYEREVICGQLVQMNWECDEVWTADTITVTTAGGDPVDWTFGWDADDRKVIQFEMPGENVHVAMTSHTFSFDSADFILPADTLSVEANSFQGDTHITAVVIPANCGSIGAEAFKDCTNLSYIRIPQGCEIGEDAFDGCEWVHIYGTEGSPAWQYCETHDNCIFVEE